MGSMKRKEYQLSDGIIARTSGIKPKRARALRNVANVREITALETATQKNSHVQIANQNTFQTIPTVKLT